jgi:hypothetical protein
MATRDGHPRQDEMRLYKARNTASIPSGLRVTRQRRSCSGQAPAMQATTKQNEQMVVWRWESTQADGNNKHAVQRHYIIANTIHSYLLAAQIVLLGSSCGTREPCSKPCAGRRPQSPAGRASQLYFIPSLSSLCSLFLRFPNSRCYL